MLGPRLEGGLRARGEAIPGLKSTMARRQPSSVLSICMSRILDTSSVNTLQGKQANTAARSDCAPCPARAPPPPQERPQGLAWEAGHGPGDGCKGEATRGCCRLPARPGPSHPERGLLSCPQDGLHVGSTSRGPCDHCMAGAGGASDPDTAGRVHGRGPPSLRPGPGVLHPHCSLGASKQLQRG